MKISISHWTLLDVCRWTFSSSYNQVICSSEKRKCRVLILMVLVCDLMFLAQTKYFYGIDENTNNNYKVLTYTYLYKLYLLLFLKVL